MNEMCHIRHCVTERRFAHGMLLLTETFFDRKAIGTDIGIGRPTCEKVLVDKYKVLIQGLNTLSHMAHTARLLVENVWCFFTSCEIGWENRRRNDLVGRAEV